MDKSKSLGMPILLPAKNSAIKPEVDSNKERMSLLVAGPYADYILGCDESKSTHRYVASITEKDVVHTMGRA